MHNTVDNMLTNLKKYLSDGTFTPARHIDAETFICFTEQTPSGMLYHQGTFEALPDHVRHLFNHRGRGERVGPFKIVAVFDFWVPTSLTPATARYNS